MMPLYDLVIKGGTVVAADTVYDADVGIRGPIISGIGDNLAGKRVIDATDKFVLPGGVDIHVHLQHPLGEIRTSDTFFTGTRAAALGGTTAIVDFVEAKPAESLMHALSQRRAEADGQVVIDYGLHITIQPGDMHKLDEVPALVEAGCPSFKHYMAYGMCLTDGQLLRSFAAIAAANGIAIVHAENWDVIKALMAQNLAAGRFTPHWHPRSRPPQFEGQAAGRAIDLAAHTGVAMHIFHVSCDAAVRRVREARGRGLPIFAETCPHYLVIDDSVYDRPGLEGALPVCAPPIRTPDEQGKLWAGLARGDLQLISTDHCPLNRMQKEVGMADFSKIPGGVPGIESRLSLLYTYGVLTGRLSLSQWVRTCCTMPARLMGFSRKGDIAIGYDADLVIYDPVPQREISVETIHEQIDWTIYEGVQVRGVPQYTLSRGDLVVDDGQYVAQAGRGRFVRRQAPVID